MLASSRGRTGNRTVKQMRHPLLKGRTTKLCASIACQCTVGTSRRDDIILRSRSPRKCHYPLFAYPLFKRAQFNCRSRAWGWDSLDLQQGHLGPSGPKLQIQSENGFPALSTPRPKKSKMESKRVKMVEN